MFKLDIQSKVHREAAAAWLAETGTHAARGGIPAAIGACGALGALIAAPIFLAPASVPMSLLGVALGHRAANPGAVLAGLVGLLLAGILLLRIHSL